MTCLAWAPGEAGTGADVANTTKRRKAVTIREVAERAGVSIGTVSRVVNLPNEVSLEIRSKVDKAIVELGYRPNMFAQGMRNDSSKLVGCIIRDITISPLALFFKTAQKSLEADKYTLLVVDSDGSKARELDLLQVFARRRLDGMIVQLSSEEDEELDAAMRAGQVPFVLMDRNAPLDADAILVDHKQGVLQAVEYLIGLGHRRIALLTGRPTVYPARARIDGFKQMHRQKGIEFDPALIRCESFRSEFAFHEASALLGQSSRPTALIAGGLDMLAGLLRAIKTRGLQVPKDISVIACGDSQLAELTTPATTVVRWDLSEVGRLAASMLLDRLVGNQTLEPRRVIIPVEFVLRGSCGPALA